MSPSAIGGFLLALCPLTNTLLGWRGSGVLGAAETGNYFFFGGKTDERKFHCHLRHEMIIVFDIC